MYWLNFIIGFHMKDFTIHGELLTLRSFVAMATIFWLSIFGHWEHGKI